MYYVTCNIVITITLALHAEPQRLHSRNLFASVAVVGHTTSGPTPIPTLLPWDHGGAIKMARQYTVNVHGATNTFGGAFACNPVRRGAPQQPRIMITLDS